MNLYENIMRPLDDSKRNKKNLKIFLRCVENKGESK